MDSKEVLVTGGAGYIGSQTCKYLEKNGFLPITYDNLSEGNQYAVKWGPFTNADLNDSKKLNKTFKKYKPIAVMHFAANALVFESVINPKKYYENNVIGTLNLLDAMLKNNVEYLIFSSSCATYGQPEFSPITESHPQKPISAYGKSKYMIEQILQDYQKAYGLKYISLRYFNAAGADLGIEIGEDRKLETHLIPLALDVVIGNQDELKVYGTDFDTKDGTAIRDYIHTHDLASAHLKAMLYLMDQKKSLELNLGSEKGFSVIDVIKAIEEETQKKLNIRYCKRRDGDPAILFADASRAKKLLDWTPKYSDLKTIIQTALRWQLKKKNS